MKHLTLKTSFGTVEGIAYPEIGRVRFYLDPFRRFELSKLGLSARLSADRLAQERASIKSKLIEVATAHGWSLVDDIAEHIISFTKS